MEAQNTTKWTFGRLDRFAHKRGWVDSVGTHFVGDPYVNLTRESIQNSMDVRVNGAPAKVSFEFVEIPNSELGDFYGVRDHIEACKETSPSAAPRIDKMLEFLDTAKKDGKMCFLKVSDRNTSGMTYYSDESNAKLSTMSGFLRSSGFSIDKPNGQGGSYGFGKTAYYRISPLRSMFVSTHSKEKGQDFFEGLIMLCDHKVDDQWYNLNGYFDANDGEPSSDGKVLEAFRIDGEPGTDVYIPVAKPDEAVRQTVYHTLIEAVLRNFWYSIDSGYLEVTVGDVTVDKGNIEEMLRKHFDAYTLDKVPSAKDFPGKYNPMPYFDLIKNSRPYGDDAEKLDEERENARRGEPFFIKGTLESIGDVTLYLQKCDEPFNYILTMRKPRMVIEARKVRGNTFNCYALFVCESDEGNKFLANTENPAHSEWNKAYAKNDVSEEDARAAIAEINHFIRENIVKYFSAESSGGFDVAEPSKTVRKSLNEKVDPLKSTPKKSKRNKMREKGESRRESIEKTGNPKDKAKIDEQPYGGKTKRRRKHTRPGNVERTGFRVVTGNTENPAAGSSQIDCVVKTDGVEHVVLIDTPTEMLLSTIGLGVGIGRESGDKLMAIPIKSVKLNGSDISSKIGEPSKNESFVNDITLRPGQNELRVVFVSESRHSLNITLYEA